MGKQCCSIGVFDSGVGGISVLRSLVKLMPNEDFIYYGDSANAPYGTKTHDEISLLAFKSARHLAKSGIKALVVACNTATSVCIDDLRKEYKDIPVIGIEPALKPAVESKVNPTVVVMATPLTLKEKKFASLLQKYEEDATIIKLPCAGLAELVESGETRGEKVEKYLKDCFSSLSDIKIDSVVLGCTHYPFVEDTIKKLMPSIEIFDGGLGTARHLKRCLEERGILSTKETAGTVRIENSLDDEKIIELSRKLLYDEN